MKKIFRRFWLRIRLMFSKPQQYQEKEYIYEQDEK